MRTNFALISATISENRDREPYFLVPFVIKRVLPQNPEKIIRLELVD